MTAARRVLIAAVLAACALGFLAPAARADGDPGSDVLVYQNLFVAADANMPIEQQVELGNLLSSANGHGFPVRVAVIAQRDDLGAITALWDKPAAYASFLGTELSLAYTGRLVVVMPDGFGFYWNGHPATAASQVLAGLRISGGGVGLATAAESAVRALAAASGVHLAAAAAASAGGAAAGGAAAGGAAEPATARPGGPAARGTSWNGSLRAVAVIAALDVVIGVAVVVLAWRLGVRPPRLSRPSGLSGLSALRGLAARLASRRPRVALPGTLLAAGFVGLACAAIVAYAALHIADNTAQANQQPLSALADNANLDPGTVLSGTAPGFTLTDQFGQPVSLSAYRGKAVLLAFNDSECTTVCPLTTAALVQAKAMLGAAGSQVQLLGIDANPKAISVEDVLSYSQLHGMLYQWRYLTGSLSQLQSVWKAYSVGVTINANQIDHEPAIFVITPDGKLAKLYLTQMAYSAVGQLGQLLASELASVLPGHPAVHSHLSYIQVGGISPAAQTTLPGAAGGYVSLGPGQGGQAPAPRLYLFFATWDQEITSLGGQLDALNAYQSAAAGAGLPGLTAVDEGSVEPSASALPGFLGTLRQPLSYPVAIDGSGQVADGYGVQGQPWFVLVSADGKAVWSWEVSTAGWPSAAVLDSHVRAALAATPSG